MKNSSPADIEHALTPDEGEPGAELQQELRDVLHERRLDGALLRVLSEAEEVEPIRVLQALPREV
jgi:hypothetical protein